jgi:hypothetical protein
MVLVLDFALGSAIKGGGGQINMGGWKLYRKVHISWWFRLMIVLLWAKNTYYRE